MQTFDHSVAEYGLGLFPRQVAGMGTAVGHDGAIPGYQAQSYHLLEHELTVTIITNNRRGASFEAWGGGGGRCRYGRRVTRRPVTPDPCGALATQRKFMTTQPPLGLKPQATSEK